MRSPFPRTLLVSESILIISLARKQKPLRHGGAMKQARASACSACRARPCISSEKQVAFFFRSTQRIHCLSCALDCRQGGNVLIQAQACSAHSLHRRAFKL